jgi:hypothetical protein
MPKNIVIFSDRTGRDGGVTAVSAPVRFVQKLLGSIEGAGIQRNINRRTILNLTMTVLIRCFDRNTLRKSSHLTVSV